MNGAQTGLSALIPVDQSVEVTTVSVVIAFRGICCSRFRLCFGPLQFLVEAIAGFDSLQLTLDTVFLGSESNVMHNILNHGIEKWP
ncbi:MAG: hypothetical protein OXF26_14460, partial [Alphaproteobacteria bacterium]|nr:hypothetical protein [Alphaproteobacteria bacterium]